MEPEIHPVDILIDMVVADEMDPWDIDIMDIANKFVEKVHEMERINLRLSGKTILTTSILLRMKSESLLGHDEEDSGGLEWFFDEYGQQVERTDIPPMPVPLRRRTERKTTLFELISALQTALGEEMIRKNFPRKPRVSPIMHIEVDEEDITDKIDNVYEKVKALGEQYKVINFYDLILDPRKMAIIDLLLSLLYLDNQKKIKVWQNELFGEIFIALRSEVT